MSASGADAPKYKLCPTCRHIYPATSNFCPQDQTALIVSSDIVAGRYILSKMVGAGAMGKVFMAEDTQLGRRVALKLLKPGQDAQRRSDLEAKAVGALDHDNVVRVYERGQHDDGRQYIAMEYLEGESLRTYLATQGRLPLVKAMELWVQAVRGVAAAHRKNVVHRDLKPDNLFLARRELDDGPIEQLKVLDFGIAQISDRPVRGTVRIGTPGYVAPEQWMHGKATARSDVYSLGIILLEMLTGLRALAANPQAPLETLERLAIAQTLSPSLRQLLTEVLSEEPEARPADARLLLERLRGLSESQLLGAGAIVVARETPAVLNLATSGEPVRPLSRSSEELQPLGADDDDADTEQVGIESLRPPAPVASPPAKGLGPATVRAPHLPGIVPTPTPARPTGIRPEKPPAKPPAKVPPLPRAPAAPIGQAQVTEVVPPPVMPPISLAGPDVPTDRPGKPPTTEVPGQDPAPITAPVPQAVSDLVTGQVTEQHPDLQNAPRSEPGTASRSDPAGSLRSAALSDLMTDPLPEKWNLTLPENELTNRLPLLAQSTLVMGTPAEMRTLNLPALGSAEGAGGIGSAPALPPRNSVVAGSPGAAGGGGAPGGSSSAAGGLAATVLSGRTHASTLGPSAAQTLPLGQMSQLNPMSRLNALSSSSSLHPLAESRSQKLQDFLNTPTVLGSRARLMMVCAVLGLLVVAVIGLLRR